MIDGTPTKVYVLFERWPNDYDDCIEDDVIGVFSTEAKAKAAQGERHNRLYIEYLLDNTDNV